MVVLIFCIIIIFFLSNIFFENLLSSFPIPNIEEQIVSFFLRHINNRWGSDGINGVSEHGAESDSKVKWNMKCFDGPTLSPIPVQVKCSDMVMN